jgi:hypothetical protein
MSGTNERVRELIKRVYTLGYDVGYHHHSEIGWVSDTYNALAGQADDAELKNLLRQYYRKGIEEGEKRRKRDIHGRTTNKVGKNATEQNNAVMRTNERPAEKVETDETSELPDYETAPQVSVADRLLQQPHVLSMPGNIMRTVLINQPVNLRGFLAI